MEIDRKKPEDIAKEALERMNKEKQDKLNLDAEKKKAESKGAASESSPEKQKSEAEKSSVLELAEKQAKKDEEILSKKDDELNEDEKKRKEEILSKKKEVPEDKVNKRKAEIQAEIDKLISEKKSLEDVKQQTEKMREEMTALQKDIDKLKSERAKIDAEKNIPEEQKVLKKKEEERLNKYLTDDKELPREQRREMSKEELEEWLLEDMVSAQEWLTERSLRRSRERVTDINIQKREKYVKDFIAKQEESNRKVLAIHPELNTAKREAELKAKGMNDTEIHATLLKENEKYRISAEIVKENPELYLTKENGPELVAAELEKRLKSKSSSGQSQEELSELEKLKKEIDDRDAEIARLKGVDETLPSSQHGEKPKEEKKTEFQLKQEAIAKRAGISPEQLKRNIERRAKIVGANS